MYSCYQIIRLHKKVQIDNSELEEINSEIKSAVSDLVISETLEVLIPLIYIISFVIGYHGHNASILGNIRNYYWQYQTVDDIGKKMYLLFAMVGIDIGVGIFSALILWKFCKIHLFRQLCRFMKTYWSLIAIKFSMTMTRVCNFCKIM